MAGVIKFTNYELSIERLIARHRKENGLPKSVYKSEVVIGQVLDEYWNFFLEAERDGSDRELIEANLILAEFLISELVWNERGCKVLFIETKGLAESLLLGKYRIPNPDELELFSDCFMLSLPRPVDYVSEDISSLLVLVRGYDQYPGETFVEIRWLKGNEKSHCSTYYRWSRINNVLDVYGYSQYKERHQPGDEDYLTGVEFELVRLVSGVFVYSCIDKGNIKTGFPNTRSLFNSKIVSKGDINNLTLVQMESSSDSADIQRASHYRTFHFRQLIDDRYYKGKYKELPKGSRVIPVRGSYVGKVVDPYRALGSAARCFQ